MGKCKNHEVPINFGKFKRFLDKHVDGDLYSLLNFASIGEALHQVSERQLDLKSLAHEWNPSALKKCFNLLDYLSQIEQDNSKVALPNLDQYKIQTWRFYKLAKTQEDPCVELSIWKAYKNNVPSTFTYFEKQGRLLLQTPNHDGGCDFLKESVQPNSGNDQETLEQVNEFYKRYNPKTLEETAENIVELDSLFKDGKVYKRAYDIILEYLGCRMHYYKNGGEYKEPSNKPLFEDLQVIDGEKFIQEDEEEELAAASQSQDSI